MTQLSTHRRGLLLALAGVLTLPLLQGCIPAVATGVGVGAAMLVDRRTSGTYIEDEGIEWRSRERLRQQFGDGINANVTSYNRVALLTGEVPSASQRASVEAALKDIPNLRGVINELSVGGVSSLTSRANDALISSKVKGRLLDADGVNAHQVKVVTEAGTVYLMGLLTREEADIASDVARTTSGVVKVVRVFEYITREEANRLDRVGHQTGPQATPSDQP